MNPCQKLKDSELFALISEGNEEAFVEIYARYARRLKQFVFGYIHEKETSEDLVQDIFIDLWRRHETLPLDTAVDKYLFRAAKNQVLNYIRSSDVRKKYIAHFNQFLASRFDNSNEETQIVNSLQSKIDRCIAELPWTWQQAFRLSRFENVRIQEIAQRMRVSPRTVEGYLSKTLAHLRASLTELMTLLIFLMVQ